MSARNGDVMHIKVVSGQSHCRQCLEEYLLFSFQRQLLSMSVNSDKCLDAFRDASWVDFDKDVGATL